ncbi:MAG TPA: hypothetical protein VH639_04355 [Bryobacteraceae bacterium]
MRALTRFLFWDYKRASWQYDVMCAIILGFIFLTPRDVFRDQPKAANVEMLPAEQGMALFWIAPELLDGVSPQNRVATASTLVSSRYKTRQTVTRVEPILDGEMDITGYMAYAQR